MSHYHHEYEYYNTRRVIIYSLYKNFNTTMAGLKGKTSTAR